jgi:hypothetical protein
MAIHTHPVYCMVIFNKQKNPQSSQKGKEIYFRRNKSLNLILKTKFGKIWVSDLYSFDTDPDPAF